MIYSKNIICPPEWQQSFIVVSPDNVWSCGERLNSLKVEEPIKILAKLDKSALLVPHMFCLNGMTLYRYFFHELLGFNMVGSTAETMRASINKSTSRKLVSHIGVKVAPAELIVQKKKPTISYPFIVKPNSGDNSSGVSLVQTEKTLELALDLAFDFDSQVLIESFIPGRELRVAVIEIQDEFLIPAIIEYPVSKKHPIRKVEDKLEIDKTGIPNRQAKHSVIPPICPADIDSKLLSEISTQAIKAHQALKARHYSLFDFRIDSRSEEVVFLEAGLFWSFSEASMISTMVRESEHSLVDIIDKVWSDALIE